MVAGSVRWKPSSSRQSASRTRAMFSLPVWLAVTNTARLPS